jgi:hypothetical protein
VEIPLASEGSLNMRVTSPLADVEFRLGRIEREGSTLVLSSAPGQAIDTTVHVSPKDVVSFFGKLLRSPSALLFVLAFPYYCWRARGEPEQAHDPNRPW